MRTFTKTTFLIAILFCFSTTLQAQTIQKLIDEVDYDNLVYMLKEFSGEKTTKVGGKTVTIKNRKHDNNDLAKDYIIEKVKSFGNNLQIETQPFNKAGKNVVVTQTGMVNPDDVWIISAHYDSVTDFCADDNATGVVGVLEIMKTLSSVCLDNTVKYIFWDEEEIGLLGSDYYAKNLSKEEKAKLKGVINIDMLGFDYNNDRNIPIHTKKVAKSIEMKDAAVAVVEKYNKSLQLSPEIPREPVEGSDHASFWKQNITAIMVTDGLSYGTITPHYHKPSDKIGTLDLKYLQDMTKSLMAMMADFGKISKDQSPCTFSLNEYELQGVSVYPNPVKDVIKVNLERFEGDTSIKLMSVSGQVILNQTVTKLSTKLDAKNLASGVYFVKVTSGDKEALIKVVKE